MSILRNRRFRSNKNKSRSRRNVTYEKSWPISKIGWQGLTQRRKRMFEGRLFDVVKWGVTLGQQPQSFLGASWIRAFLHRVPESKKRIWALRLLSMSPHYFIDPHNPAFRGMSNDEYLERSFDII